MLPYLLARPTQTDFYLNNLAANTIENGTITMLLVKDFTGTVGQDLDTNDDGVLDMTPMG